MSTAYEIKGIIKVIGKIQAFGKNGFQKREVVITTNEKYPQDIKIEFVKEECDRLESFTLGDVAKISFNVRGNEYQGKYYVSLQGWKIEGNGERAQSRPTSQNGAAPPKPIAAMDDSLDDSDDVPF